MTTQDKDRIECAIRHIQTAVDVDPWAVEIAVEAMEAQLSAEGTTSDLISRQAAIDRFCELLDTTEENPVTCIRQVLDTLPSAQPESLSDAYINAVWTWLLDYQIKAAELKGRSIFTDWLINPNPWMSAWGNQGEATTPRMMSQTEAFKPYVEKAIEAWNRRASNDESGSN